MDTGGLELWGANCASGMAAQGGKIYFSEPCNNNSQCPWCRTHMDVIRSRTDGQSWDADRVLSVWPSEAAYSVLVPLRDGSLGLLYERGSAGGDHYHNISFARIRAFTDDSSARAAPGRALADANGM